MRRTPNCFQQFLPAARTGKAFLLLCILLLLSGCTNSSPEADSTFESWGSFTPDKTYSYDEKYYAIQEVELLNDIRYIKVCIYETETDTPVNSFYPARAWDFWGICWENDTYNIWTQSADIGVYCYKFEDMQWLRDESAQRPEYIISKYDKYLD